MVKNVGFRVNLVVELFFCPRRAFSRRVGKIVFLAGKFQLQHVPRGRTPNISKLFTSRYGR